MYTFETQWPAPFTSGWRRSAQKFPTVASAALALADWLAVSFENDVQCEGRLVLVETTPERR